MSLIRQPVATHFYPGNLRAQISAFLSGFAPPKKLPPDLMGAIVPHAGWAYSGGVAARTLSCLVAGSDPDTGIILGTDHTGVRSHSLYPEGAWLTPLGSVEIDDDLSTLIVEDLPDLVVSDPNAHRGEHSIEVLVPMLKYFWPGIKIVPITVRPDSDSVQLGSGIGTLVKQLNRKVVFLASTDLTHYGSLYGFMPAGSGTKGYRWLRKNDRRIIDRFRAVDGQAILTEAHKHWNACGAGAAAALVEAVSEYGRKQGFLVEYTTSHDPEPESEFTYGVGYAGVVY